MAWYLTRISGAKPCLIIVFQVLSFLVFLSTRFNEELPVRLSSLIPPYLELTLPLQWNTPVVYVPLILTFVFGLLFVIVELKVAPEPMLAPFLLRQKIPVLVGLSNFLVATCNFTVMYNFPTWFQTVMLTSASEAGEYLLSNELARS